MNKRHINDAVKTTPAAKVTKYADLQPALAADGMDVEVFGFAIGSLDFWHQGNARALARLRISRRLRPLMRCLLCIDAIKGSRDIYIEHVSGHHQKMYKE